MGIWAGKQGICLGRGRYDRWHSFREIWLAEGHFLVDICAVHCVLDMIKPPDEVAISVCLSGW
jgi:hypothetical protein